MLHNYFILNVIYAWDITNLLFFSPIEYNSLKIKKDLKTKKLNKAKQWKKEDSFLAFKGLKGSQMRALHWAVCTTATHRSTQVYDADLVSDLPIFKHDPLFALICIFLYADSPLSALLKRILSYHCAEGEPDSSDVRVCQRTDRQTASSSILQTNHDSQPACHEERPAPAKQQYAFLFWFKQQHG